MNAANSHASRVVGSLSEVLPMAEHELLIDARELDRLVLECAHCKGRVVIPLASLGDVGSGKLDRKVEGRTEGVNFEPGRLAGATCLTCGHDLRNAEALCTAAFTFFATVARTAALTGSAKVRFLLPVPSAAAP